jgi:hypothetical protein
LRRKAKKIVTKKKTLPPKEFQQLLNLGMTGLEGYNKSPNVLGITKALQKELKETLIHLKKQLKLYKLLLEFKISRLPKYFQPYAKLHFQKAFQNELPKSVLSNEKHIFHLFHHLGYQKGYVKQ